MPTSESTVKFGDLPEVLRSGLEAINAYSSKDVTVGKLEENILSIFSAHAGKQEDYLPTGQRVAIAAGWLVRKNGKLLIPMFSRNAEMYIGDMYLNTPDVSVQLNNIDVLTASRVIFPNGGYTPGGKIPAFRENQKFLDLYVSYIPNKAQVAFEFNHKLQEACYMPCGMMLFDEPDDWFIEALVSDVNVLLMSVNDIQEDNNGLPLTEKAKIFLGMVKQYIKELK
jgi:hypothetical protein